MPDSIADDGELIAEIKTQCARKLSCPVDNLPKEVLSWVDYFLEGGKQPTATAPTVVAVVRRVLRELLKEYSQQYPVPGSIYKRLG